MSEDSDTRKQVEQDLAEDLELEDKEAADVGGGDGTLVPGNVKWEPVVLKRGTTG